MLKVLARAYDYQLKTEDLLELVGGDRHLALESVVRVCLVCALCVCVCVYSAVQDDEERRDGNFTHTHKHARTHARKRTLTPTWAHRGWRLTLPSKLRKF